MLEEYTRAIHHIHIIHKQNTCTALQSTAKFINYTLEQHTFFVRTSPRAAPAHLWPCQSSSNLPTPPSWEQRGRGGGWGMFTMLVCTYVVCLCLYRSCCPAPSVSTYLFPVFTLQPNLNDSNTIRALKHLSLSYLCIRFSRIPKFIVDSLPL